jgi:hypothetical protein
VTSVSVRARWTYRPFEQYPRTSERSSQLLVYIEVKELLDVQDYCPIYIYIYIYMFALSDGVG